jgi:hypothetical protein
MLSLFLLWPTGSTLGLVLAVVGTGVWLGVQHLNYIEFGELRRVAQRTIEQRQIVINNLSVRRAVEELKVAEDFDQVRNILVAAFEANDFDGFELHATSALDPHSMESAQRIHWSKFPRLMAISNEPQWKLALDLVTTANRVCGSLVVFRTYSDRDLQLDVNLLTSQFPVTLADALDRISSISEVLVAAQQQPQLRAFAANL